MLVDVVLPASEELPPRVRVVARVSIHSCFPHGCLGIFLFQGFRLWCGIFGTAAGGVPLRVGRRGIGTVFLTLIGLSLAVSACGNPSDPAQSSRSTSTSQPGVTSTTTNSTAVSVLKAYRAGWTAYDQALSNANAYDPALVATMVDPLLQKVRAALLGYQAKGIAGRGSVQLHPKVTALTTTSATVVDCVYSSSELVYTKNGNPVPPVTPPEHDGVTSTLVIASGGWKVSQQTVTEGKCPAGS